MTPASPQPLTVGSLFAGIGGFDLGFERAGFEIRWQVEIDPFATAVLAQHWPQVERFDDVRAVGRFPRRCVPEPVDVLCGGFPCQDISNAGARIGIDGHRSGLWSEIARLAGELRPRYIVVENVAALLARGMGRVLGDLAALGYDAEWDCLPASAVGALHRRDRVWIVAYPSGGRVEGERLSGEGRGRMADVNWCGSDVADADQLQRQGRPLWAGRWQRSTQSLTEAHEQHRGSEDGIWFAEPNVGRVADGVSARVDRLRGLGNAVVPQITEWIAKRILEAEQEG